LKPSRRTGKLKPVIETKKQVNTEIDVKAKKAQEPGFDYKVEEFEVYLKKIPKITQNYDHFVKNKRLYDKVVNAFRNLEINLKPKEQKLIKIRILEYRLKDLKDWDARQKTEILNMTGPNVGVVYSTLLGELRKKKLLPPSSKSAKRVPKAQ
jgi:hypothetical protein